jgi:hypothetical protein
MLTAWSLAHAAQPAAEKAVADPAARVPAVARSFVAGYATARLDRTGNMCCELADLLFTNHNNRF